MTPSRNTRCYILRSVPSSPGRSFFKTTDVKIISQVTHGVRQVVLCKDADGKIGLRVKAVNKGSHHRFEQLFS